MGSLRRSGAVWAFRGLAPLVRLLGRTADGITMENTLSVFREYGRLERLREAEGLSVDQLQQWMNLKHILSAHFRPGAREFADKQASLRVPSRLRVSFESFGQRRECLMTNISRGGVFVSTQTPLPIGTPFKLWIVVDGSDAAQELPGEVATVNVGADLKGEENGMGIRFCILDEAQQALVDDLYGAALSEALKDVE